MLSKEDQTAKQFLIPPKIKSTYQDFKLIAETSSYRVFEAESRSSKQKHTIRVLDRSKDLVNNEFAITTALFVQELLQLQYHHPGSIFINTFEITDDGQHLACAILNYTPLSCQIAENKKVLDPQNPVLMEKLISDALFDIEFLRKDLQLKKIMDVLGPENICFIKEKDAFFMSNWAKVLENVPDEAQVSVSHSGDDSQELAGEIKGVALAALKLNKVDVTEIEQLRVIKNSKVYNLALKAILQDCFSNSKKMQSLLERMLSLDLQNLPKLDEFRLSKGSSKTEEEKQIDGPQKKTHTFENGERYEGDWLDGKPHGIGTYFYNINDVNKRVKYTGSFFQGKRHGFGKMEWIGDQIFEGQLLHDTLLRGKMRYATGQIYEGSFKDGLRDGYGVSTYASGERYEGNCLNGKYHGFGKRILANGTCYEGMFKVHDLSYGVCSYVNGEKYEGDLLSYQLHGKGTYFYTKSDTWKRIKYTGEFCQNKRHGYGKLEWTSGEIFEGSWINDNMIKAKTEIDATLLI